MIEASVAGPTICSRLSMVGLARACERQILKRQRDCSMSLPELRYFWCAQSLVMSHEMTGPGTANECATPSAEMHRRYSLIKLVVNQ